MPIVSPRKQEVLEYFESISSGYNQYRKRFSYYGNDIIRYINFFIQPEDKVLEIGCGCGETIAGLRTKDKTGIDFSPKMIEEAKKQHPDIDFHVMDAEAITLTQTFDVIIFNNIIGYLDNIQDVFTSIHKNCHQRTHIIISYYNFYWEPLLSLAERLKIKKKSPYQNWLNTNDITNLLFLAGFETYKKTDRLLVPINIPVISTLFNRYLAKLPLIRGLCLNKFLFALPKPEWMDAGYQKDYSVSICIPARNESGNIENAIKRIPSFGKSQEIIFVEGNSTDDTWQKIQEVKEKYKDTHRIVIAQQSGKGKGDAVRKGYAMAQNDILMILDADLTMPPEELPKFYEAIASGKAEFINGSRLVYPMDKDAMRFLNLVGNKFFSIVLTWLLEQNIKDSLCGTKVMFRKDYIKLAANRSFFGDFDPFGDFDLLFGAYKLNLKIIDLPIRYKERTYGETNISRFKHGFILLKMCWFAAFKIKFW
jgi:trans-aconitate methyltransferase